MTAMFDALTTPVSLTVLTATKGHASKKLIPNWSDGAPIVDPAQSLWISEGYVEHVQVAGLAGLQALLGRITPKEALVHGIVRGSAPGDRWKLVVAQKDAGETDTVARTLEHFSYPPDRSLLMFDYDVDPTAQVQVASAADLMAHLTALWPAFGEVGYLRTVSTRSAIRPQGQSDAWLTPPNGMHVYFLATGDVARFRELLKIKLWCAGLGFCKLATANKATGVAALLERALVDLTVLSPERLDYVAGAQIHRDAPFYQDRPPPELHAGIVLNLDDLPDATREERQDYASRLAAARETLRPAQREQVRQTITQQAPTLAGPEQEQEITRRLTHAERDELLPEHVLYFPNREMTAQALTTKAGKTLDGKRLRDPQEPDYGLSQAVLHWRSGDWRIVSWAHGVLKTYRLAPTAPALLANGTGQTAPQRTIQLDTNLSRIVDEGEDAILHMRGAPRLYQRARLLTIIARGVKAPEWLARPPDLPVMIQAAPAYIYELASQSARWQQWDERKEGWKAVLPPRWFVPSVQGRPSWEFPVLSGLVQSPTLRANGTILATPGYDTGTGLYVDLNGTTFPAVPERPTLEDARKALKALKDVLVDFPFAEPYHRSAALAAILSMAARFAIAGPVPLFAVRATAAGSGKGLLVDALSLIGTGRPAPRWPETVEPEEERKRILTIALAGYPAIHLDNVSKPLGSASLDDALTSRTFSDRLLGTQTPLEAPLDLVWFASGNNMQFRIDTSRRVVPIDLDPKMEKPEERTGFTHNPLLTYVSEQRPALAVAAITVLRAFCVADRPAQTLTQMGSFEAWSDLVRQALVWAGEPDPNEGRKEIDAESAPAHEHLATLLECWAACYVKKDEAEQEKGITLGQVKDDIFIGAAIGDGPDTKWDDLRNALGAYDPKYDQKSLNLTVIGAALRERKGSVIDHKRLVKAGLYRRAVQWRLQAV